MKYLYFDGGSNNALLIPANRLLSMDQTGDTNIRMTFEHKDGTTSARTTCDLTINTGKEKQVMQTLTEAVHGGRENFVVVADSVTSQFIDNQITAVSVDNGGAASNGLTAGAGITGGTGTVYHSWVEKNGNVIKTSIYLDLTGLGSSATANDIVGTGTDPAHIGQITAAQNGTIFAGVITCLETPTANLTDIDLHSATEGTGAFDGLVTDLTNTELVNTGGVAINAIEALTAFPAADEYLYISSATTTAVTTAAAGVILIELYGTV